ncbi:hypothetical protein JCGZ_07670 [Jatropha curcas]|uniref:Uncharacterized protein n=1 Tax=Jatropha curcas TaxID=180498 RepID=A0A067KQK0_JATCU|nr:hypothetical protein JCGZ_07670 [Jatropha curcas]
MEGSSKSAVDDVSSAAWPEFLVETDLESELSAEFPIKEEMIEEVMQELYKEITGPASTCTETAASPSSETTVSVSSLTPPSSLSSFSISLSSPFFVNSGKSESCGVSVSNSASSVMAGVEYAGVSVFRNAAGEGVENEEEGEGEEFGERLMMDGCDGVEFGDEWLEKVMGWAPLEFEGWS